MFHETACPWVARSSSEAESPWHEGHRTGYATNQVNVDYVIKQRDALGQALRETRARLSAAELAIEVALDAVWPRSGQKGRPEHG